MRVLVEFLALAAGVAAASLTLSKATITDGLRDWVAGHAEVHRAAAFVSDLLDCPYCTSHWVAALTIAVFHPHIVSSGLPYVGGVVDLVASWGALITLSAPFAALIFHSYKHMK